MNPCWNLTFLALFLAGGAGAQVIEPQSLDRPVARGELIENRQGSRVVPQRVAPTDERLAQLKLPEGFRIAKFADRLGMPRIMAVGDDGTLYVTRPKSGDVVALRDTDGDGVADARDIATGDLPEVHGITLHDGKMYLVTVNDVYVADMEGNQVDEPKRIIQGIPPGGRHPNRTLGFGPDGMLYITVGSTCNCCFEPSEESAAVLQANPQDWTRKVFASGLRNTIGFGWHPQTKVMWGMDHGSDWLGDDFPPEELNRLEGGKFYGWPLAGGGRIIELQTYPEGFDREEYLAKTVPPVLEYQAHAAPIQMAFYTGTQFPAEYRNDAFVAMHGSWNREPPIGYEVVRIDFNEQGDPVRFEPFITGFLVEGPAFFGRPCGVAVGKDGSLFIGDDANGVVYRVSYGAASP